MKFYLFFSLVILLFSGCKNSEKSGSANTELMSAQKEPVILSMSFQILRSVEGDDLDVVHMEVDTLDQRVSPLPVNSDMPEIFKIEILDSSNQIVYGAQNKTSFKKIDGEDLANVNFYCTVPTEAVKAKIYYQISSEIWKQVTEIDL